MLISLCIPPLAQPTLTGLHELDYPSLSEVGIGLESLPELSIEKSAPLPPELMEQFGSILFDVHALNTFYVS